MRCYPILLFASPQSELRVSDSGRTTRIEGTTSAAWRVLLSVCVIWFVIAVSWYLSREAFTESDIGLGIAFCAASLIVLPAWSCRLLRSVCIEVDPDQGEIQFRVTVLGIVLRKYSWPLQNWKLCRGRVTDVVVVKDEDPALNAAVSISGLGMFIRPFESCFDGGGKPRKRRQSTIAVAERGSDNDLVHLFVANPVGLDGLLSQVSERSGSLERR